VNSTMSAYHIKDGITQMPGIDANDAVARCPDEWSFIPWTLETKTARLRFEIKAHRRKAERTDRIVFQKGDLVLWYGKIYRISNIRDGLVDMSLEDRRFPENHRYAFDDGLREYQLVAHQKVYCWRADGLAPH
jgi:hypothetical protein